MGLMDALGTVGAVLDTPRAVLWHALRGKNPLDVANPFDEEAVQQRTTGHDLLKGIGLEPEEGGSWLWGLPAMGLEMLGDPMNAVLGGALWKRLAAGRAAEAANAAREPLLAQNLRRESLLAKGAMPEEIADKTVIRTAPEAATPEARDLMARHLNRFAAGEPMTNAEFAEAPKFREMLEKSIVADPERRGPPAMVYHGTSADFPEFAATKDIGYHFGNPMQAHDRLLRGGTWDELPVGSNVRRHYLDVRNPLVTETDPFTGDKDLAQGLSNALGTKITSPYSLPRVLPEDMIDAIRRSGHDAVVYGNRHEGPGLSVAVLDPSQVYSPFIAPRAVTVPPMQRVPSSALQRALMAGHNVGRPAHSLEY